MSNKIDYYGKTQSKTQMNFMALAKEAKRHENSSKKDILSDAGIFQNIHTQKK